MESSSSSSSFPPPSLSLSHTHTHSHGQVAAWIADRTIVAGSDDVGRDLEHAELLQKKFDDFNNDVTANETRVDALSHLALDLISGGHPENDAIKARLQVRSSTHITHEESSNAEDSSTPRVTGSDLVGFDSRVSSPLTVPGPLSPRSFLCPIADHPLPTLSLSLTHTHTRLAGDHRVVDVAQAAGHGTPRGPRARPRSPQLQS